jgi:hypothetical protein
MVFFNASNPSAAGTEYYDIIIDDSALTEDGFTRFKLPLDDNATKMVLYNDKDPSMITYIDFDKYDLIKSVNSFEKKLLDEQIIESKLGRDKVTSLIAYFTNTCFSLQKDSNNEFFKNINGNGNGKERKTQKDHLIEEPETKTLCELGKWANHWKSPQLQKN